MAEDPSFDSPMRDFDLSEVISLEGAQTVPSKLEFILGDNTDSLFRLAKKFGALTTEPDQIRNLRVAHFPKSNNPFISESALPNGNPILEKITRVNKYGMIEIDQEKLKSHSLNAKLQETAEVDPSELEKGLKILRNIISNFEKEKAEVPPQQIEEKKKSSFKENEKFTEFKYEKRNKLWNWKLHLRETFKKSSLCNDGKFSEEGLLDCVESELYQAVNIFMRIAYPKPYEKQFLDEFSTGAPVEEVEPLESMDISIDHFEFCHKELKVRFLELIEDNIYNVAKDVEKNPEINNLFPSFEKFLSDYGFQYPQECFTVILAILKNPYRKFEFVCDDKLLVVNEQTCIAEYLVNCFTKENILCDKVVSEKLAETVIAFANINSSFLAPIVTGFADHLLSKKTDGKYAYQIYCQVLNIMSSIGATIILLCLPQHFGRIACLAANNQSQELYINLLRACEILIADSIENESLLEAESSDENHFSLRISFFSDCYKFFGSALTNRLLPVFRKYKERKYREERYLSKKHCIYPSKDGYTNMEMQFLKGRGYKISEESYSASRVFCSPTAQLCHKIQEIFGLSDKDLEKD